MTTDTLFLPASQIKAGTVYLPGSKSISNRTLLLAALSDNQTEITSLLHSDDTQRMLSALVKLGIRIDGFTPPAQFIGQRLRVYGHGGRFARQQTDLFLGNAGTAFRPLTAVLAMVGGDYDLHGVPRMHQRPIGDLVDALRLAGAHIDYSGNPGFPPLHIGTYHDNGVYTIPIKGNVSSQFLTALLMALPLSGHTYTIEVIGELISQPYIDITLNLMAQFGVSVQHEEYRRFYLPARAQYHAPAEVSVEGDASSASYFLAAGLISGNPVRVVGVGRNSIQGDVAFADELARMGATVTWGDQFIEVSRAPGQPILPFDLNANRIPDAAMTLAVLALACKQTCHLRHIGSWRVKETDRIAAMATELRKLGAVVEETANSLHITPPTQCTPYATINTYDDHRMAMCFALVSLMNTPIYINDPQCVNKTFPEYFDVLAQLTA